MSRHRLILAALLVAVAAIVASPARTLAMQEPAPAAQAEHPPAGAANAGKDEHAAAEAEGEGHDEGWMPTIAKIVNFVALVGILGYFLRTPLSQYLVDRHASIRKDLADAQTVRATAETQLAGVRARLAELPAELLALEERGRNELAHERERMKAATAAEREKLLERTRREIDLHFRVARRDLLEHTADLAMALAKARITQAMTPDDQMRLIERYATEVHS